MLFVSATSLAQDIDLSKLPAAALRTVSFVNDIQPILERSCLKCHSAEVSTSGLRLDDRQQALKGGDQGADILPGNSSRSRLVHLAARLVPKLEMPPEGQGEPLTTDEIALLRAWIDQGAPWPNGLVLQSRPKAVPGSHVGQNRAPGSHALPPALNRKVDFVNDIRPLLAGKCYSCHGPSQQKGQLRWDVKAIAAKGGVSGPAFEPGRSAESLVIRLVAGMQPDLVMPLQGDRLSPSEIGLLRAWIDQGAQWPDGLDPKGYRAQPVHWAYRPLAKTVPPQPKKGGSWARTPVDQFILAKLQEAKLRPSPEADRRTLLRRVTYDLTGLPPTPDDIRAFLADNTPEAYSKVVDRLLASPRYGEHWARHWLDVVHYADSHGHDQDRPRDNAWPYRDYVIRSFNEDKSYARFVKEQLAGDVLSPNEPEAAVATGFIGTGPFDESSMMSIVDDTIDKKRAQTLDRDDMVMTTMSTFLSSTVHCARCHNHKFDPISQQEYYRLQAIFAGVDRADRPYDPDPALHARRQSLLKEKRALDERRGKIEEGAARLVNEKLQELDSRIQTLQQDFDALEKVAPQLATKSLGYQSQVSSRTDTTKWVQIDLGKPVPIEHVYLVPVQHGSVPGFGFPERFRVDLSNDPMFASRHAIADRTVESFPNPGTAPFAIQNIGRAARYVRVTAFPSPDNPSYWFFALAELLAFSREKNVAAGARVTAQDSVENLPQWSKAALVDGATSLLKLMDSNGEPVAWAEALKLLQASGRRWQLDLDIKKHREERKKLAVSLLEPALRTELASIEEKLAGIVRQLAELPPSQMVYAGTNDFADAGNFHPTRGVPRPIHFLKRGEITTPGELVSPGSLSLIPELGAGLGLENAVGEGARRAALAEWITHPKNSLAWRSIVNRVWHYHFGRGLVNTPNDFGRMGGSPSHPELLDWLAAWFLENGGSLKRLHRLILTSAVYRQTSQGNAAYAQVDAENRYLWRMNRTRMDAESVHDSILQVTGKLDVTMGGPPVKQFFYDDPNAGVTPIIDYSRFDVDSPASFRRSIYRYVFRTVTDPLMDSLDCPDASQLSPVRNVSVTALQALTMWNNRFVVRQAEHFAERVGQASSSLASQIDTACELAWGRPPTATEAKALLGYATKHGMANTCRVLLNGNEFMFVN